MTIGMRGEITAVTPFEQSPTNPGPGGLEESRNIHQAGLHVWDSQIQGRPQLAVEMPDVERGTMQILPDGSMEVLYRLRDDVKWDDRTPFTARDVAFSWKFGADARVPVLQRRIYTIPDVVEAGDESHALHPLARAQRLCSGRGEQ